MMTTRRLSLVLLFACSLCLPGAAEARKKKPGKKVAPTPAAAVVEPAAKPEAPPPAPEPATPRARATVLYKEANGLLKKGMEMAEEAQRLSLNALDRYRKAFGLFPSYKIELHIAYSLQALGNNIEAATYLEKFFQRLAATPQGNANPEAVEAGKARLDALRTKLASVKVGGPHDGATVLINGEQVGRIPMELPHYVPPGSHIMEVELDGFITARERLLLKAGDHRAPAPALISIAEQERARREQQARVDLHRSKTMWGYTAMAGAAAFAVGAAVLYGVGASRGAEAHDGYVSSSSIVEQQGYADEVDSAKELLIGGHVLIGVAAVAAGISAWQLLTRPELEEANSADQPGVTTAGISPVIGGAQLNLGGRF